MTESATPWEIDLAERLDGAYRVAMPEGRNVTVWIGGNYRINQPIVVPAGVVLASEGEGVRPVRLSYRGEPGTPDRPRTIVSLAGGWGGGLRGVEIVAEADNLIGIGAANLYNATIADVRVDLRGTDCIGVDIRGRESVRLVNANLLATVPLCVHWGDNLVFRDLDLAAATEREQTRRRAVTLPSTCVRLLGLPNHWTFDGYQTWAGAERAMSAHASGSVAGSGLFLSHVRYEQSLSLAVDGIAAWDLDFPERPLEAVSFGPGCRHTARRDAMRLVGVHRLEISPAAVLPGRVTRS